MIAVFIWPYIIALKKRYERKLDVLVTAKITVLYSGLLRRTEKSIYQQDI
jgi:hypothetical protein